MSKVKEKKPLSGVVSVKAAKGIMLPVVVAPGKLVRITETDAVEIDVDKMPYSAKNILNRAYMDDEIIVEAAKGGK